LSGLNYFKGGSQREKKEIPIKKLFLKRDLCLLIFNQFAKAEQS
jgi:hypothetical protein